MVYLSPQQLANLKRQRILDARKKAADEFFAKSRAEFQKHEAQRLQEYQKQQQKRRK